MGKEEKKPYVIYEETTFIDSEGRTVITQMPLLEDFSDTLKTCPAVQYYINFNMIETAIKPTGEPIKRTVVVLLPVGAQSVREAFEIHDKAMNMHLAQKKNEAREQAKKSSIITNPNALRRHLPGNNGNGA